MLAVVTIARKTTHKRNCKNSHRGCTIVGSATMGTSQITINISIYQHVDTAFELILQFNADAITIQRTGSLLILAYSLQIFTPLIITVFSNLLKVILAC